MKWNRNILLSYFVLMILAASVSLRFIYDRYQYEHHNRNVEYAVSYRDAIQLALVQGVSPAEVFKRLKLAKVGSIALEEDTIEDLVSEGRVSVLKGSDIINAYRIQKFSPVTVLNYIYSVRGVEPHKFYIVADREDDFRRLRTILELTYGDQNVKSFSRRNVIELSAEKEDVFLTNIGFDNDKIRSLSKKGFNIIPRLRNSPHVNEVLIRKTFADLKDRFPKSTTLIFEGDSVLGFPNDIDQVTVRLANLPYSIGKVEFQGRMGMDHLVDEVSSRIVKVHTVSPEETVALSVSRLINRYIRAVKERNVRLVLMRLRFDELGKHTILDRNIDFVQSVIDRLEGFGFSNGPTLFNPDSQFRSAVFWELMIMVIAVFSSFMMLLHIFVPITFSRFLFCYASLVALYYFLSLVGYDHYWYRLMAVVAAVTFPTLAVISQFPSVPDVMHSRVKHMARAVSYSCRLLGISLIAPMLILVLLSDYRYLVTINQFYGVKLSFLLPIVFVSLYFFLAPNRVTSVYYVFKRLLNAPVQFISLFVGIIGIVFISLYMLRSGNYIVFNVPLFEISFRESIENLLFVRPRLKEFLIGYPLLMFAYVYFGRDLHSRYIWFFNGLGVVALISVVNSFCHFHTPIWVSFYRSLLGLGGGILVAFASIFIYGVFKRLGRQFFV